MLARTLMDLGAIAMDEVKPPDPPAPMPTMTFGEAFKISQDKREEADGAKDKPEDKAAPDEGVDQDKKDETSNKPSEPADDKTDEPPKPAESKDGKADGPNAETPAAADAKPEKEEVVVKKQPKVKDMVREEVERVLSSQKPDLPPAAHKQEDKQPPKRSADDDFVAGLDEAARDEYALAQFAAQREPDKYKDLPQKVIGFFKKVDAYIQKAQQSDPGRTFDETDQEFQQFVAANRPKISTVERTKLMRSQIAEEAAAKAREAHAKEMDEIRRKTELLERKPKVESELGRFSEHLAKTFKTTSEKEESLAGPIFAEAEEKGWDAVESEDPLHAPIVRQANEFAVSLANKFLSLSHGVENFDPKNEHHAFLAHFITTQEQYFQQHGGDKHARVIRGQKATFLPREEYIKLVEKDPAKGAQHWTFSDQDVLNMLALQARTEAERRLKEADERLRKAGYVRQTKKDIPKTETKPEAPPKPVSAPKAGTSIAPGAGKPAPPLTQSAMSENEIAALGIPLRR